MVFIWYIESVHYLVLIGNISIFLKVVSILTAQICWKRPVTGVREMCDACETTLFNLHWVCPKCGFGVCCDCYNTRRAMTKEGESFVFRYKMVVSKSCFVPTELEAYDSDKNNLYRWMRCTKGKHHLPIHLMPTQIIPRYG